MEIRRRCDCGWAVGSDILTAEQKVPPAAPRPIYPASDPARFGNIEAKYILQNPLIHLDLHAIVGTVKFKKRLLPYASFNHFHTQNNEKKKEMPPEELYNI